MARKKTSRVRSTKRKVLARSIKRTVRARPTKRAKQDALLYHIKRKLAIITLALVVDVIAALVALSLI